MKYIEDFQTAASVTSRKGCTIDDRILTVLYRASCVKTYCC